MKIINLNKFKTQQQVQIDSEVYDIYGIPVGDIIDDDPIEKIDQIKDPKSQVKIIIDTLCKYSNIPQKILKSQPFNVLTALIYVIQGIDPEKKLNRDQPNGEPGK